MKEIEAISGIFKDGDKVLLLRRNPNRTFSPGKWDLMGGDIQPGEKPEEVLKKDSVQKLNIQTFQVEARGEVLVEESTTTSIRRHVFTCEGDYMALATDPTKYDQYGWFDAREVNSVDTAPGVRDILKYVGFIK